MELLIDRFPNVLSSLQERKYRVEILKWEHKVGTNSAKQIRNMKQQTKNRQEQSGGRNWNQWRDLRDALKKAYEEEELYWKQKSRTQ